MKILTIGVDGNAFAACLFDTKEEMIESNYSYYKEEEKNWVVIATDRIKYNVKKEDALDGFVEYLENAKEKLTYGSTVLLHGDVRELDEDIIDEIADNEDYYNIIECDEDYGSNIHLTIYNLCLEYFYDNELIEKENGSFIDLDYTNKEKEEEYSKLDYVSDLLDRLDADKKDNFIEKYHMYIAGAIGVSVVVASMM